MKHTRLIPFLIGLVAFIYYATLSSKVFSWIFVSGDSGDWLAASIDWFVPQPLGSPFFILLGHFLNLFPGDLIIKMTLLLSCLPSAITVALVYLITKRLTNRIGISVIASLVLLGGTIFMTQSTILEQYALSVMFVVLAFYLYLLDKKYWTAIVLALGMCTHIVIVVIAFLWLMVERKSWRNWVKPLAVFIPITMAFYSLIPILMWLETPPYIAGYLNWHSYSTYNTATANVIIGNVSIFDLPEQLALALAMLIASIGLAIVPITYALKKPVGRPLWIMAVTILFALWYHITNLDRSTWTFMSFGLPFMCVLSGIGLSYLPRIHRQLVTSSACLLILLNGVFLNANLLVNDYPEAEQTLAYYQEMPQDSVIVVNRGHYSLCIYYARALGRVDLIPLIYLVPEGDLWPDYNNWMKENYNAKGNTTIEWVHNYIADGHTVYMSGQRWQFESTHTKFWPHFSGNFSMVEQEYSWIWKLYPKEDWTLDDEY